MTNYFFEFPKTGLGISGGERCMLENVLFLSSKGMHCTILTTDNGKIVYEKFGVTSNQFINYQTINSYSDEKKTHVFFSYIKRTFKAICLVFKIKITPGDVLICNSDFFPNTIPFFLCALFHPNAKLIYWWRVMAPDLFKGFEGQFIGKLQVPRANIIHYKLNQILYRISILRRGTIVSPVQYYNEQLKKMFPHNNVYIFHKYGGVDLLKLSTQMKKNYDIVWMGRFQKLKGLDYLIQIIELIKKDRNDIKCLIIGGGTESEIKKFFLQVHKKGLEDNIVFKSFLYGEEKIKYLKMSKVFVMTSYFESYGQVILEALAVGLPVVAYDLPTYNAFRKGIIKVPILNNNLFALRVQELLSSSLLRNKLANEASEFAKNFSWEKTSQELLVIIEKENGYGNK